VPVFHRGSIAGHCVALLNRAMGLLEGTMKPAGLLELQQDLRRPQAVRRRVRNTWPRSDRRARPPGFCQLQVVWRYHRDVDAGSSGGHIQGSLCVDDAGQ
jgi:hypothetical protein